ncbi:MAG TPA: DUF2231 domain-containing protein [Candidatus Limnocylindria bacterium]|nr:DUF2231 domain-containing protein [Candidatus Limnocylindria bacterium]
MTQTQTQSPAYSPADASPTHVEPAAAPARMPSDDHRSTASIGGHPLHPLAVTVPIGLFVATTAADVMHAVTHDPFFSRVARWLLRGAVGSGAFAAVFGATDFFTIAKARGPMGVAHATGNATILGLSAASLAVRRRSRGDTPMLAMVLSAVAASMLMVTGWLGGELSYRKGIGVVPHEER